MVYSTLSLNLKNNKSLQLIIKNPKKEQIGALMLETRIGEKYSAYDTRYT